MNDSEKISYTQADLAVAAFQKMSVVFKEIELLIREARQDRVVGAYFAASQSMFEQWSVDGPLLDVVDHVNCEKLWFGGDMWMRACREIEKNHTAWGRPLEYMTTLSNYLTVAHIYSRPLDLAYRAFQEAYSVQHPGFQPIHIPSKTHFLTLESAAEAAASIISLSGAGHARLG